jgi:hypothetical protein
MAWMSGVGGLITLSAALLAIVGVSYLMRFLANGHADSMGVRQVAMVVAAAVALVVLAGGAGLALLNDSTKGAGASKLHAPKP